MGLYENIKDVAKAKGVSIASIEEKLGFARSSMCKWNENAPSVLRVQKVAEMLNVPIGELLDKQEED